MKNLKSLSGILVFILVFQLVISSFFWSMNTAHGEAESVLINFQTGESIIPDGYLVDSGQTYDSRNGNTYGWNTDHTAFAVQRGVHEDDRLDTFISMSQASLWEIELANGMYDVTVSVGDAVYGSVNTVNLEGITVWASLELGPGEFYENTSTVNVTDGKLSLDPGTELDAATKINYIDIHRSEPIVLAPEDNIQGLKGEYFNGTDFNELRFVRLDETVDFDWGGGAPADTMDSNAFSVRWTGNFTPLYSEEYTLHTETHGGVRLWVDGQLQYEDWNGKGSVDQNTTLSLIAGQAYDITLEYMDDQGGANARLYWSSPKQPLEIIPGSQLNPPTIPEPPTSIQLTKASSAITLSWEAVSDAAGYDVEADGVIVDNSGNTTFIHKNLGSNTEHSYRVRSKVPGVAGNWSPIISGTTTIGIPENLTAIAVQDSITISWNEVSGAKGYDIEVDGVVIENNLSTVYVHEGLMPNTDHTYRVRAKNGTIMSDWTELLSKTLLSEVPTNIQTVITATSITLSWDDVVNAIGYEVEADGTLIDTGALKTYIHNGLQSNTLHTYRVRAIKADGASDWSAYITKSTMSLPGNGTGLKGDYYNDDQLIGFTTEQMDQQINFDWGNNSPAVDIDDDVFSVRWTGQLEARFTENYTFTLAAHGGIRYWINGTLLGDDWSAHNMTERIGTMMLEAGKRYDIQMEYREVNGTAKAYLYWESESQAREIVPQSQLYPIGIPDNFSTSSTETSITLKWDSVSFADRYEVEVDGVVLENGASQTYTHNHLLPGTQHTYRVRANNSFVVGEWSSAMSAATLLGDTAIEDMHATETAITVMWESVQGATSYDIEVDGTLINNGNNTIYVHEDLWSGTEHSYRVRARTNVVKGNWTSLERKWTLPDIPQHIITIPTSTSITLEWGLVRGATGYEVEVYNTILDIGNVISYTEENLNSNMQRTYRIRAKNSSGLGKWSPIIAEITLPAAPTNLQGTASDISANITWDPSAGAEAYDLEVDGTVFSNIQGTSYNHIGLLPNSTHTYRVRATTKKGHSEWSASLAIMTLPSIPANVLALASSTSITLTWNSMFGITGYDIEVDGLNVAIDLSTKYVHAGLAPVTEHTYRVRAKNGQLNSYWSDLITIKTLPGIPQNLQGSSTSSEITLTWDLVSGASGYEVEADGHIMIPNTAAEYIHSSLASNSSHTYRVRAVNDDGAGEWSEALTLLTKLDTPTFVSSDSSSSSITIIWGKVEGAGGYDVYADGQIYENISTTTYEHSKLEPFTFHVYRVRARDGAVIGEWSEAITLNTKLGTPANISTLANSKKIMVAWDDVTGAVSYEIELDGIDIVMVNESDYIHEGLLPNTVHSYRIRSKNAGIYSDWSPALSQLTAPGVPEHLQAKAKTDSITLTWDKVPGALSYEVEVDGKFVSVVEESFVHKTLQPNTMHVYRVRAKNSGGSGDWTKFLKQSTIPQIELKPGQDITFNFVMVVPKNADVVQQSITVTYNPEEVEVLDLSALTQGIELEPGRINGTNITVLSFEAGTIVYLIDNSKKTVMNSIKFLAKTNNYSKITYTFE